MAREGTLEMLAPLHVEEPPDWQESVAYYVVEECEPQERKAAIYVCNEAKAMAHGLAALPQLIEAARKAEDALSKYEVEKFGTISETTKALRRQIDRIERESRP